MYKQDSPNTIKIELTEGCNLKCSFCGINGIREKSGNFKFLTVELARILSDQIKDSNWKTKIEFTMHGEPLMNPEVLEILNIFRNTLPKLQLMITSNSLPLLKPPGIEENINSLFNAGLNILAIDCYKASEKVWRKIPDLTFEGVEVSHYPGGPSPNLRYNVKEKRVILIKGMDSDDVDGKLGNRIISNHIGAAAPVDKKLPYEKRCARPFRELSVRWDGRISLCCNDWRGEYKCGDVKKEMIYDIWQNEFFTAARKKLYHKDRKFGICVKCDNTSFRVGILPDKVGKKSLPKPNKQDEDAIKKATKGSSYTVAVLRPWELTK